MQLFQNAISTQCLAVRSLRLRLILTNCLNHPVETLHTTFSSTPATRIKILARGFPNVRQFSDNILGHSPMARPLPTTFPQTSETSSRSTNPGPVWGTDSNTAGGGVWSQTSAKKEKLSELLTELNASGVDTGK